jgi:FKBP-type peptidyl-prolyl cis-trans isomerase
MKQYPIYILLILLANSAVGQSKAELESKVKALQGELDQLKKAKAIDLNDPVKRASYGMGVLVASNIKGQGADSINTDAFTAGLLDFFGNQPLKLDQQQCNSEVQQYMQGISERRVKKYRESGSKFLETNKLKKGVTVTASGLQYEAVTSGSGLSPGATDKVTVYYSGKLIDGTIFDGTQPGRPATFSVNQLVMGWREALQLMKEGDKWVVYIPYNLGYGERGSGAKIPPYATLVFELELVKVN